MSSKIGYRVRQFWQSFYSSPDEDDWEKIRKNLSSGELILFQQLPLPDQNHCLRVLDSLEASGEDNPDLLKSALLHDLGKTKHPLKRWERVFAVLIMFLSPARFKKWSRGKPTGWKRPLVIIAKHPHWGADLARGAGSAERVSWLIDNHENKEPRGEYSPKDLILLRKLQKADNQN
jgi:hypothetical protein